MNLYAMLADPIRRLGGKTALGYGEARLSYAELDRRAAAFAALYASLGAGRGDRILVFLPNCLDYAPLVLGAMRGGLVAVPVNAKLHPREVAWICGNCTPKVVVAKGETLDMIAAELGEGPRPALLAAEELEQVGSDGALPAVAEVSPDDPAWLFYTSGTTGRPKGAVLTHRNLIAQTVNCLADMFDFRERDLVLHVAPLSHGSGLYLLPSLARGAENLISDRPSFQPDEVLDLVAERRVTVIGFVAPTMIVRLLEARPRDDVGHLRGVIYGGAPIHLDHIRAAVARFGPIFHQLYGQGEAPMTISYLPGWAHENADDETLVSAGFIRAGVEVRLVDGEDREVAPGEEGEICARGDVVMKGYWENPAASEAALRGGWLHTGDIGRFDGGGRLRVLDRRHDTIISGGTNIYPKEVEDVVASYPGVREVIAFGLPDPEWGECVAVAVVREADDVGEDDLVAHCRGALASFKKPRRIFFVEELPKSAYGKVLRRELRERFGAAGEP